MEHLLFAGYLVLFAWLATKVKFLKKSGLTSSQLVIVFLLKVIAGIFYGWIGVYYGNMAQMVDTWAYHYESIKEYHLLQNNPIEFFTNIFRNNYEGGYENFLSSTNSWWNDFHVNFIIKILALFNVLSFGNYYVNVIFYSFITLFGPVAIYRVMQDTFPDKKLIVLLATFLIPSFLYWTSGIHKDGLTFLGLAAITYQLYSGFKEESFPFKRIVLILLGMLLVLALRTYLIIILIPAITAWMVARKMPWKPLFSFLMVYILFIVLFFTARYVYPKLDFPQSVVTKQQDFLKLHGGSAVATTRLQPTFLSFIKNAPEAFSLATFRPYPSDVKHLLSMAAAIEIGILILLFFVFLIWRCPDIKVTPFLLFCMFLSFSLLLTIGYTVNFLGAIVRYRSIGLPFIVIPMLASINWNKVNKLFFKY